MQPQPLHRRPLPFSFAPVARPKEAKVAVLLNAQARRVNAKVIQQVSHVTAAEDLFLSRSELEANRIMRTVLDRRYDVLFMGGGDGTFVGTVNELFRQLDQRRRQGRPAKTPRLGILKLGTGNGLAHFVGASHHYEAMQEELLRARSGEVPGQRQMNLLEVDGQKAPFAGLGVDGRLLNDYLSVKRRFSKGPLRHLMSGGCGYFSSVALKTVPHYLQNSAWVEGEVINGPHAEAYLLDPQGQPVGAPIAPGARLFEGRLMMAAAATMPFYGYGLRMFPFAHRRPGMMHLRLGQVSALSILANLDKVWAGRWFPEGLQDYHAQDVTFRCAKPMPVQVGGDAAGYRDTLRLSVASETVDLMDFRPRKA